MNAQRALLFLVVSFVTVSIPAFIAHPSPSHLSTESLRLSPVTTTPRRTIDAARHDFRPVSIRRQRKSVGPVQMMGLFGLGAPEIIVILVAAAFLLGPQKLAELGKDAGKIAGELKDVPKEFQKGLEEGESEARSRKAKPMEKIEGEDTN